MDGIKAVVFDFYNTLAAPIPDDFWVRLPGIIENAGGVVAHPEHLDAWEVGQPLEHLEHSTSEMAYRAWQARRLEIFLQECSVPEPDLSRIVAEIEVERYERLFPVFPDVVEGLSEIRRRGYVIGICSNWDWDLQRHIEHNSLSDLLDFVVCSAIHGHRKPHPAIFSTVIAHAGTEPGAILFVGDSLGDDIGGATMAGLVPVHIDRAGSCDPTAHDGVACIGGLDELLGILDRS